MAFGKRPIVIISTGCPSGVGPEVSVAGALRSKHRCLLVGDIATLLEAARVMRVDLQTVPHLADSREVSRWRESRSRLALFQAGPKLAKGDRRAGRPSSAAGAAQLAYVRTAFELARGQPRASLATAPVSKAAIARSPAASARNFRGHTEWLMRLDGAARAVMCFTAGDWATSLVTTHLAHRRVARALTADKVEHATVELAHLLHRLGVTRPKLAVCSLNPHAGESELLGREESVAIMPGIARARTALGRRAMIEGPIGAETAYRKAQSGQYAGVVAMYHDQATIPTKLVAFGSAVNVTMGLSIARTSVDHGTAYDIAWKGVADASGMRAAIDMAAALAITA